MNPEDTGINNNLARIYLEEGNRKQALFYFKKTLKVDMLNQEAKKWIDKLQPKL